MSAPFLAPTEEDWTQAFVASVQNVMGENLTPEYVDHLLNSMREEFARAYRYSPADDYDFTRDEGDQDVSGGLADRQAAKEWWRATGGDEG